MLLKLIGPCLALLALTGCKDCRPSRPAEPPAEAARPRPNVLLITLDTTRADRLGCYGFGLARTPNIDRIAHEGVRVAHAIASAPITAPSHSSMLSGLYPPTHGVRDNGAYRLPDAVRTLPEVLHDHGYMTSAFVSANVLHHRYNLSQGFDVYDDDLWAEDAPPMFMIRERRGDRTVARAQAWLEARRANPHPAPFFTWVHLFDVHQPHEAPLGDSVLTTSAYDAEIASVDRYVGMLLDTLAGHHELENTIIILTADHGESLDEHGEATHAVFVYESTTHVPFIVRYPSDLPRGSVYAGDVRHVDIFPTILNALGIEEAGYVQGQNLWNALRGRYAAPRLTQYSESIVSELGFGMAPLFSVRQDSWTYIRAPRPELYNRANDPGELHDLSASMPDKMHELDQMLSSLLHESEAHAFASVENPLDRETIESLRALGYVGDPGTRTAVAGMDPKDGIEIYETMHRARALVRVRHFGEATALAEQVLEQTPNNVSAVNLIALCQMSEGHLPEARATYERSLSIAPQQSRIALQLASIDVAENRLDDAKRRLDAILSESSDFVEGMIARGGIALREHDNTTAEQYYQRALAADPSFPRALQSYADFHFRQREYREALTYYERALANSPRAFEVLNQAGVTARRLGDTESALRYFARAEAERRDSWIPAYNRGCALAMAGRADEAMSALNIAADRHMTTPEILDSDTDLASLRARPDFPTLRTRARAAARHAHAPSLVE